MNFPSSSHRRAVRVGNFATFSTNGANSAILSPLNENSNTRARDAMRALEARTSAGAP